jgi:hypothetical protein
MWNSRCFRGNTKVCLCLFRIESNYIRLTQKLIAKTEAESPDFVVKMQFSAKNVFSRINKPKKTSAHECTAQTLLDCKKMHLLW